MPVKAKIDPPAASSSNLIEIPHHFLLEKSQWTGFKKAVENAGLTWNLPDWLYTITYKGADYKAIKGKGEEIDEVFPSPIVLVDDEKKKVVVTDTSKKWLNIIGMPKMSNSRMTTQKFCNLTTLTFEADAKLPARQRLWAWMVHCLHGPKTTPGLYYYVSNQIEVYDISGLFKRLAEIMDVVSICSLDDEVYNVTHLDFDQSKHDLFGYVEELRIAIQRLADVNSKLPEEARVTLSETYIRSRIVRAARVIPTYKTVIDNLIALPIDEWSKLTVIDLLQKFETASANDFSLQPRRVMSLYPAPPVDDTVLANYATQQAQRNQQPKMPVCFRRDYCEKKDCPFDHSSNPKNSGQPEKPRQKTKPAPPARQGPAPARRAPAPDERYDANGNCKKCRKPSRQCICKCTWCAKMKHTEGVCRAKKENKPRVMIAEADADDADDGMLVNANLFIVVEDEDPQFQGVVSPKPGPELEAEMLCTTNVVVVDELASALTLSVSAIAHTETIAGYIQETFICDSGANRNVHPNNKASSSYFAQPLSISTAAGGKTLVSEGVGEMLLFTEGGTPISGFNRTIFCKNISEKLCSVSELCNAGYVFVFDDQKVFFFFF